MNSKRILALVMALMMVVSMFAACGGTEEPAATTEATTTAATTAGTTAATTTEATTTEATTTEATTTEATTTPEPALDLTGYEFTIMTNNSKFAPIVNADGTYASALDETWANELMDLEDTLGVTISLIPYNGDALEQITTAMLSGDTLADLLYAHVEVLWPLAKQQGILPLDDERLVAAGLDYTDATRWYQPTTQATSISLRGEEHAWGLNVASEYIDLACGYFVTFDHAICAAAGYEDMYQLVRDHEWTWDVYMDIAKKATKDLDGDGQPDQWGTGATAWGNEVMCNEVQFVDEVDGKWVVTIDSEAGVEALQFLYDMNWGSGTINQALSNNERRQLFADGYVAFNWADMGRLMGEFYVGSNHEYGIIPAPMGPRADKYYTIHNDLDGLCIQANHRDLEKAIAIANEWALIANDPEGYLEILRDGRCPTEEDEEMMIEYILPNYALNNGTATPDLWSVVDDDGEGGGLISQVSYYGMTPQQAIEAEKGRIQAVLDSFFNN